MKRLLYFFYYIKQTPQTTFRRFLAYAAKVTGRSRLAILLDAVGSTFRYNISLLDYFYFRFYSLTRQDRTKWAGTGFLYEFQLRMNPKSAREVLLDKNLFLQHFRPFVKRSFAGLQALKANTALAESLLGNASGRLVLKGARGQVGAEVEVVQCAGLNHQNLIEIMQAKGYDLAEEYVIQHPALMALSPSGLNTLRIFTQLHKGKVDFLGARLRVSVNSPVDNMAAGNLAAPVDEETGRVYGPGVYSDITRSPEALHPVTGIPIENFQIPFWPETLAMVKEASELHPHNRSIGWDIVITPEGPGLIEGNHDWCKLVWQLPVGRGLKHLLEQCAEHG